MRQASAVTMRGLARDTRTMAASIHSSVLVGHAQSESFEPASSEGRNQQQAHEGRGDQAAENDDRHRPLDFMSGLMQLQSDWQQCQCRE